MAKLESSKNKKVQKGIELKLNLCYTMVDSESKGGNWVELFANRLRQAMEQKHLKQVDVIRLVQLLEEKDRVKLGKSHMSQYLSGKTEPRREVLKALAKVLDVSDAWLLGREDDIKIEENSQTVASEGERVATKAEQEVQNKTKTETEMKNTENMEEKVQNKTDVEIKIQTEQKVQTKQERKQGIMSTNNGRRAFTKSTKLENVLYDVRGPVVDEASRMEAEGKNILKLNIGNPAPFGFRTPDEVIHDMSRQLTQCEGYSDSKGLFSARKAIMQYAQLKKIPNVTVDDIYTGNGVSELINLAMQALLDDGDEILIPSPDYPLWTATATLAGGKAVHYVCDEQAEWNPDIDDIKKKITDRTKAIVIINPNNPTGALYPKEVLQEIVQVAREHQLIIFSDEIYDRLVMDGEKHVSIASLAPDLFCVTFSGLSKSHMIAGFRIGWMVLSGRKEAAKDYIEGLNMLSNMRLCSNVPAQSIVQTALGGYQSVEEYIVPGGRVYEQREFVYNALCDIPGISVVKPKAAFYAFPKIDTKKFNIVDDERFALDFLKEKKVLLIHGGGFNWSEPDHFRIVYLPRLSVLREAMGKLSDFLQYYRQ